ncbi:Crp/Fnr family transcriptional regulator [Neobacillus sp. MM2021_6]|uniref:Crp/Fnr family transcriptional regulator n=1 Tax=Bacillaceae TaxID=186817 RepID=UPI001407FDEB|nr:MULTISPECIES: Crp/Fnr family transcriptional regulator [Bacillaceae]MBO0958211.1 Crp/Fnr family transcriptional regulator [Neobacillus sp. MM2021_6]NHC17810.1 Crp/Fnr family transcriptional regulator [Bacillus sp. MM2020_4]WML40317.1 Crp/Fnr family transcriptional regulator [Neobacillus sp. OS1-2]
MKKVEIEMKLSHFKLFKDLSDHDLEPFLEIIQARFYKQKMYVYMQNDSQDKLFFLDSGKVKICKTDLSGKEQILYILESGDMFPQTVFFKDGKHETHAEVMEDARIITFPRAQFEEILLTIPDLCARLFKLMGENVNDLQKRLEEQVLHNTYEQIILLLIRLCKSNGIKIGEQYLLTTHFTNKELANMIGTSRETVSRTINHLKKKNYIISSTKSLYLVNRIALKQEICY